MDPKVANYALEESNWSITTAEAVIQAAWPTLLTIATFLPIAMVSHAYFGAMLMIRKIQLLLSGLIPFLGWRRVRITKECPKC